jgi:class 3 adenylate cyclase
MPAEIAVNHTQYLERYIKTREARVIGIGRDIPGRKKNGDLFDLHLTVAEGKIGQKTIFCAFLREITKEKVAERNLQIEREFTDQLLASLFPKQISAYIRNKEQNDSSVTYAEYYKEVTIIFAGIAGFTQFASKKEPHEMVAALNDLFSRWDNLLETFHGEKIKVIGDTYMAAFGVPHRCVDHAENALAMAFGMQEALALFNKENHLDFQVRIGINSGPVTAGVIGSKKMQFDVCLISHND